MYEDFKRHKMLEYKLKNLRKEAIKLEQERFSLSGKISSIELQISNLEKKYPEGFDAEMHDEYLIECQKEICGAYSKGGLMSDDFKKFKKTPDFKSMTDYQKKFITDSKDRLQYYSPALEDSLMKCYEDDITDLDCPNMNFWVQMMVTQSSNYREMDDEEYEEAQEAVKKYTKNLLK
jgi:hypothetical protein